MAIGGRPRIKELRVFGVFYFHSPHFAPPGRSKSSKVVHFSFPQLQRNIKELRHSRPTAVFHSPWEKQIPKVVQCRRDARTTKNQGVRSNRRVLLIFTAFRSPWEKQIQSLVFFSYSSNSLISGSRALVSHIHRISLPLGEANPRTRVLLVFI